MDGGRNNGGGGGNVVTGPPPPSHSSVEFHPAYRIPTYMEHLYSLQHAGSSAASLHGN